MKLTTWLFHKKLLLIGDNKFESEGWKIIPCERCDLPFKSWVHCRSQGFVFDTVCQDCLEEEPNTRQ